MRVSRSSAVLPSVMAVAVALATASCAAPRGAPSAEDGNVAIEGVVASIDTRPWTYDGHAVVEVDVEGGRRVAVQLPARWNLCEAAPVDVGALAVGMRVQATGASEGSDRLTVCSQAGHRLVPLEAGTANGGGDGPADPPVPAAERADGRPPVPADGNATVGGDGSDIVLAPLSAQEIEAASLSGELGCSFAGEAGTGPLLLAMGDVASKMPARGVVKVIDYVEAVATPGGFDGMLRGARFSGAGKTVDVEVTGAAAGGGESPAHPATLTYHRADGAQRRWTGLWQCGP